MCSSSAVPNQFLSSRRQSPLRYAPFWSEYFLINALICPCNPTLAWYISYIICQLPSHVKGSLVVLASISGLSSSLSPREGSMDFNVCKS
jgi:hypothetical protein